MKQQVLARAQKTSLQRSSNVRFGEVALRHCNVHEWPVRAVRAQAKVTFGKGAAQHQRSVQSPNCTSDAASLDVGARGKAYAVEPLIEFMPSVNLL